MLQGEKTHIDECLPLWRLRLIRNDKRELKASKNIDCASPVTGIKFNMTSHFCVEVCALKFLSKIFGLSSQKVQNIMCYKCS